MGTDQEDTRQSIDYTVFVLIHAYRRIFSYTTTTRHYVKTIATICLLAVIFSSNALAEVFKSHLRGDLGLFANATSSPINGIGSSTSLLPYAYFEYGRLFGRIDTFGIKTMPLGYGHLELVGQIRQDGFQTADHVELTGIAERDNSLPVGLGTFQLTPLGGVFLYSLHDTSRSHGNIYQAFYVVKMSLGEVTLYPQIGIEHLSSDYNRYYYGVSTDESALSGYARYDPPAATNSLLSVLLEVPIGNGWLANIYLRRKWLGDAVTGSPLLDETFEDNGFVSVAYRFK